MQLILEIVKFLIYSFSIVLISKYILVKLLRKLSETLDLKAKTVGDIAGVATSVPELLSVSFAAVAGLIDTSIYNILSSNIINFIQYILSIILNKNQNILKNKALKIDIGLVIMTIIIPIFILLFKIEMNLSIVPIFILLLLLFYFLNKNAHKLYLKNIVTTEENKIKEEQKWLKGKKEKTIKYSIYLILTGIILFIVGNLLSETLENLSYIFNISEFIIGIALGFVTSIPELITFFEAQKHHSKENNSRDGVIEATNNLLTSNIMNIFVIQTLGIILFVIM